MTSYALNARWTFEDDGSGLALNDQQNLTNNWIHPSVQIVPRSPASLDLTFTPPLAPPQLMLPPLKRSTKPMRAETYHALQEWEGYVTGIHNQAFTADLVDVSRAAKEAGEQVELPLNEIGDDDRSELKLGSVFRWTIGYETLPAGQRRRVSQIVFRKLPKWTRADIDAARQLGQNRHKKIRWE